MIPLDFARPGAGDTLAHNKREGGLARLFQSPTEGSKDRSPQ
jgi:hypothetical protein